VSNSFLFTPALLRTHSFVFFAVHETRRIFLSPFIPNHTMPATSGNKADSLTVQQQLLLLTKKKEGNDRAGVCRIEVLAV